MRLIRDDIYLFTVARQQAGEIIACRTRKEGRSFAGRNIDEAIVLSANEKKFLKLVSDSRRSTHVALLCKVGGQQRAVILFRFFLDASSFVLAVVLDAPVSSAAKVLASGSFENINASPALLKKADLESVASFSDRVEYDYILDIMRQISVLEGMKLQYTLENPEIIALAAESAAYLVGVDINCRISRTADDAYSSNEKSVFSGRFCVAVLLVMAMLARRYSRGRSLDVEIAWGYKDMSIGFMIDTDDDDCCQAVGRLSRFAEDYGLSFEFDLCDRTVFAKLRPFYSDVGLAGVKDGEKILNHADWVEKFFS